MAGTLRIRQVRSPNGASRRQRATLRSLGVGRIGKSAEHADGPALRGQLGAVRHMIEVEEA